VNFVGTEIFMRDVLDEHYETLEFLWAQRRNRLRSHDITVRDLIESDERIAANTDGLVLAGPDGIEVVAAGLTNGDGSFSLASGYVLLSTGHEPAARTVTHVLKEADPPARDGLRLALCFGPIDHTEAELNAIFREAAAPVALAAAEALAFHGRFEDPGRRLVTFTDDADASLRCAAWRVATLAAGGEAAPPLVDRARVERALIDPDAGVRARAFEAAAWSRQPWLVDQCRQSARQASASPGIHESVMRLAILGGTEDLELIRSLGSDRARGPDRFDLMATFGHPALLEAIIAGFDATAPADAAAAGQAFKRITGIDAGSGMRVTVPPADGSFPDAFEQEFLDEVELPDAERALAALDRIKDRIKDRTRIARCIDVGPGALPPVLDGLDLRSRWETALRMASTGRLTVPLARLERFPMRH
jgi:uncharacterized protein (TIGR02270 family)